ncbi:MAG: ATP-dependent RNA helicase HrpA [Xanthomonadales bacterium]|nr:ATP-dependent RNA helicase HrpA [Xanthomonadales bacterium]
MSLPAIPRPRRTEVMARDFARLDARWRRLARAGDASADDARRLAEAIAASVARRDSRAGRVPVVGVDEALPIAARADEIVAAIRRHQVIVLAGETGSGKTTQLPRLCLAAGRGAAGMVGCTQPRRLAARSVARRVAAELGSEVGDLVGFQVRFTDQVSDASLVKFMTDGILLAETQSDPWLDAYDTIILDEAHERSLNIDFLLGYLKRLLVRRPDLKLIVTSATIDTARFAAHFGGAPVIEVEGRAFPVEVRWRPPLQDRSGGDDTPPEAPRGRAGMRRRRSGPDTAADVDPLSLAEQIAAVADEITADDPQGDILVFLPGEREIRDTHLALSRRKYRATEVMALYARLSAAEQDRVFHPGPGRRIVLATNVAETSLTVPRIRYVIDSGTARVKRYSPRNQLERLHVEPISQAAADQRKGRCGRVGPGICYRLYDEEDHSRRPRFTDPEILRSSLAGVILRMLALKLGDPADFPFVEAPSDRAIADGHRRLAELGAIEEAQDGGKERGRGSGYRLTAIGRRLAELPVDVALGRMLVEAGAQGVSAELQVLAAFLSIQDPRERPADARAEADAAHAAFADPKSDFLGILKLWQAYSEAHRELTQSKLRDWCRAHFLSFLRMREWRELHRQLALPGIGNRESGIVKAAAPAIPESPIPNPEAYEAIHRCLLSGWPTQVGRKDERGQYRGPRERRFAIFPGSAVAKAVPQWLLAGQILDLAKVYGMLCARVEPRWIEEQAAHLVKRNWRDAHWSRQRGAVVAYEQVTLFGMTLVERRRVQFGAQDPALAHEIFLREALARGEIDARADFIRANRRVLAEAREIEAKRRRSGLVRDEDELAAFFAGKLPADISTGAALDAWYRRATPPEQAALHWSLADVLGESSGIGAREFPPAMEVAGQALRLSYRFIPGDAADGVTLEVPLALLNMVPMARCEWLVPGLLAEKVAEAIRGLPKALRRNFVPAPDFARAFVEAEPPRDVPLFAALAAYLKRVTGVAVESADFAEVALPPYLSMNFRLHGERGRLLVESRDLAAVQATWTDAARVAFSSRAEVDLAREDVSEADFEDIPERVVSRGGLAAFPALVDLGESVALRVFENEDEACAEHRRGVERLLRRALEPRLRQARRQLPVDHTLALKSVGLEAAFAPGEPARGMEGLRADATEAALRDLLAGENLEVRTRDGFNALKERLARALFAAAMERLKLAEAILAAHAELRPLLEPPLMGFATANYEDLRHQLDELLAPGFLRDLPRARLAEFPRYLKAMAIRAERLRHDPARDQARMLGLQGYWREYLKLRATRGEDEALADLRWAIEELRVSTFAQELRTAEPVSPKRIARLLEAAMRS